jgi:hypothetical protein
LRAPEPVTLYRMHGNIAEFFRAIDAGEAYEVLDRVFVGAPLWNSAAVRRRFDGRMSLVS